MIGIVGGTGLYELGLDDAEWKTIESPWGRPSDAVLTGRLGDHQVAFLPRHGRGHKIPPHEINFRANIDVLKRAGATSLLSISAVGSLRENLAPGTFVLVDQFVDRTLRGPKTFFGTGCVAHVSMAHPTCGRMMDALAAAGGDARLSIDTPRGGAALRGSAESSLSIVRGGTYLAMEGPQFSSLAESEVHRQLGCHVVGMTNMPEAKLAREAELCYATVAMVTDFDCWHPDHDHVKVDDVVRVLLANAEHARTLVRHAVPRLAQDGLCGRGCQRSLDNAILTGPAHRDPELCAKLSAIAGRVLGT